MTDLTAVPTPTDPWESGELGRDEKYVACAPPELRKEIDSALDLQLISIRLQKDLIAELKLIADYRGIGYQPLVREVLGRFARAEIMLIARELRDAQQARETIENEGLGLKTA
jgi:hypothetical protein